MIFQCEVSKYGLRDLYNELLNEMKLELVTKCETKIKCWSFFIIDSWNYQSDANMPNFDIMCVSKTINTNVHQIISTPNHEAIHEKGS